MQRERNIEVLWLCVEAPGLTPSEQALMREIALVYEMDMHREWGLSNPWREQEVFDLFVKAGKCFGLSVTLSPSPTPAAA